MAKLFFSIHQHQPRLLTTMPPGDETYPHDAGVTYLVLQPFVLEPAQGSPTGDQILARDYLRMWSAAQLVTDGVYLVGSDEIKLINSGIVRPCPVPLPPGTQLSFNLSALTRSGATTNWADVRPLGLQPQSAIGQWDQLDGDSALGWPAFAALSNALPPVRTWADLDGGAQWGPQKEAAFQGLLAVFSVMAVAWADKDPTRRDDRDLVWAEVVRPLLRPASPKQSVPLSDVDAWRKHLEKKRTGGGTNGSWAYDLLLPIAKRDIPIQPPDPVISLPGFQWTPDGVRNRPDLFLENGQTERGYLDALWSELEGLATAEANAGGNADMPINQMLGRLFGFGERLAWPLSRVDGGVAGSKRFMALRTDLSHVAVPKGINSKAWLATNVPSLAGLVLRIPWDVNDPMTTIVDCQMLIGGRTIEQKSDALKNLLQAGFDDVANVPARTPGLAEAIFGGPAGEQPTPAASPDRIVFFAARKGPMQRLEGHTPVNRVLYATPEALLDVVDSVQRFVDRGLDGAVVRNAPRRALFRHELLNEGDVLPTKIDGKDVHAWHRRQVNLSPRRLTGSKGMAYALGLLEQVHPDESIVNDWIAALGTGASFPEAWLWVRTSDNGKGGELQLAPTALSRDADGAALVLDSDPKTAGSLSEILGYDPAQPKAFQVEIAFRTTNDASQIFDVVEWPSGVASAPPDLILTKAPLTRLSRSVDRLAGAVAMTWPVDFDPDYGFARRAHPDVQAVQFSEANKLRLKVALPVKGMVRNLSDPDAQLPLPEDDPKLDRPWAHRGSIAPTGPQAWYWLAEHFDQDAARDDDAGEETRFQLWNAAGKPLAISGYLEHQLGHRVGLTLPNVDLRRSVDVVSPADVMVPERKNAGKADETNNREPLLEFIEVGASGKAEIKIVVRREALKLAFDQHNSDTPGPLRNLYRALAELRDGLVRGNVELAIESWVYDNAAVIGSGGHATLALGMRPESVTSVPIQSVAGTDLQKLFSALDGTFEDFEKLCASLSTKADHLAPLYIAPSTTFDQTASMLRARLTLTRPDDVRAESDWAKGGFIPLAADGPEAGSGLAKTALDDLTRYLSDATSRLFTSTAWIESQDPYPDQRPALRGMGPGATKFLAPIAPMPPVDRVADLFFMPHAFVLPKAHPVLADRRATIDFLDFLLCLTEDILQGRPIDDRINLIDELTTTDAILLRRALRSILGQEPGGAVERMMKLYSRVDVPPAAAGSAPAQQLHWHAGEVLNSLSDLAKPPHKLVREKLLASPSLFSSLRAIGVGVFNRKLVRANDPAPGVNHSTFSTELIELGIKKHLIDDQDRVTEDSDKFPASDLQGAILKGEPAYYFLDLLPDRVYDDLIEVKPNTYRGVDPNDGDLFGLPRSISDILFADFVTAVRGEDILSPPVGRGIAANVVHVFPDWRLKETDSNGSQDLRTFYLLPERLPPPRARSVDAVRGDKVWSSTPIYLDFAGAPGTPPRVSPDAKWPVQYDRDVHKDLKAVTVKSATGPAKSYKRIEKAKSSTGPARYLPSVVASSGPLTAGWHLLTTSISHFWFELDLQKPSENWSVNLEDDTYDVEVEMWKGGPPPEPEDAVSRPDSNDKLLQAFRRLRQTSQTTPPPPPQVTRAELEKSLDAWFRSGQEGATLFDPPSPAGNKLSDAERVRTFRITRPPAGGAWSLSETTGKSGVDGIGAVVAFEVLARTKPDATSGPRYDDIVPPELASVLIRVSVLDTPSLVSRARLRVVRNWRDVGNDGIPDIAPQFFLGERFSSWKSEGRTPVVIDEATFTKGKVPAEGREVMAHDVNALANWIGAIDDLGATVDHGADLVATLNAKVFVNTDTGNQEGLWESWMATADFEVNGMVVRSLPDLSFLFGSGTDSLTFETRQVSLTGDPLAAVAGDKLADLISKLRPSKVRSDHPVLMLVWRDQQKMPVLEVSLPLNLKP
ncbi:hypothetical protein [Mesorhizobium sp. M6A.T.Cr.TU.016.01.1.1]|uniref:hypothetical protein n=1 Tax=Mesorhizobium sp. M6A.T.Cr.TU.016.01.1.1 TaxID=2493677 RepID=UPI000F74ED32|nr:hypothetical protein [Mesorhizobium sp. M6A.T.Cr.TU.016.01.1.1]AZO68002.1 hypothetical protein EJ075_25845 [Mesorhizobium sp. M6A.T.Cr.TU.016.01.1.1]